MIIPDSFAAELAELEAALDDPDVHLAATIGDLVTAAAVAVEAFVGLSLRLDVDGLAVTYRVVDEPAVPAHVRSSVAVPLAAVTAGAVRGQLILLATVPGAFVDLAADLTWAGAVPAGEIVFDQHLRLDPVGRGTSGLAEFVRFNQALGVLIGRGLTPEQARRHLDGLVERQRLTPGEAAAQVLDTLAPPAPDRGPRGTVEGG